MIEACKDYMYFVAVVNLWGWVAVGQGSLCCQAGPIHTAEKGAPIRSRGCGNYETHSTQSQYISGLLIPQVGRYRVI